ncbi:MAG: ABC transporter permease subunit [Alphaproteobacteria bacterium]|nr:ABC transporter permease subunit [Alphaproteobacteria bacterium]
MNQLYNLIKQLFKSDTCQRLIILLIIGMIWQIFALYIHHNVRNGHLLFPTITETIEVFADLITTQEFIGKILLTIYILTYCFFIGSILAFIFSTISITSHIGRNVIELIAFPMSSLPAVALISAAILAFKSNFTGTVFVVSNAVFWTVLAATHAGFTHVPKTLKMVGQNYGLNPILQVFLILFPASLPSILTGLRLGISRAFQAFVAVELVLGSVSGKGALGFFIAEAKNNYQPPLVYAGLFAILFISWIIDAKLFGWIEKRTVIKWGMKNF